MSLFDIIQEVFSKSPDYVQRMLTEIKRGTETEENWFLKEALRFVERERLDATGYSIMSFCTNRESDDNAPLHRALIHFVRDGDANYFREFHVEVRNNRKRRVVVWKWNGRYKSGLQRWKYVRHIAEGIEDGNGNIGI